MIISKKLAELTFEDVQSSVCDLKIPESEILDYKKTFHDPKKVARSICSFANTYGGRLVFGVSEKSGTNLPDKIVGHGLTQKDFEQRLHSSCYDNISPPIATEVRHIEDPADSTRLVSVVHISESDMTPHAVENTRVYVRFRDQNRPFDKIEYQEASTERVRWLYDRRRKHVELRDSILANVERHFETLAPKRDNSEHTLTVKLGPTYPRMPLIGYESISHSFKGWFDEFSRDNETVVKAGQTANVNDGICTYVDLAEINRTLKYFVELNVYGQSQVTFYVGQDPNYEYDCRVINLRSLAKQINLCLVLATKMIDGLNYVGPLFLTVSIDHIDDTALDIERYSFQNEITNFGRNRVDPCVCREYAISALNRDSEMDAAFEDFLGRVCHLYDAAKDPVALARWAISQAKEEISKLKLVNIR